MRKPIRWVVLGAAALGTAMYVWTSLTSTAPLPWLNGWMAAPIAALSVIPVTLALTAGPSRAEFRNGELALGTLTSMRRTGLTVNDQPQMEFKFDVMTSSGASFEGTARQVVGFEDLGLLAPGTVLPVWHLPERSDGKVGIAAHADPVALQEVLLNWKLARGKITQQQARIAREGVAAQAVVMEMRPTGEVRDGDAVIDLLLRVTRPDQSTFDARVQKAIPSVGIAEIQPGMVVRVKYLPQDEADVSIETRVA